LGTREKKAPNYYFFKKIKIKIPPPQTQKEKKLECIAETSLILAA